MTLTCVCVASLLTVAIGGQAPAQPSPAPSAGSAPATAQPAAPPVEQPSDAGFSYDPEGRRDPFLSLLGRGNDPRLGASRPSGVAGLLIADVTVKGILRDKAGSGWTGLWVDGVRVAEEVELDQSGCWLDDRFYVIEAAGPEEHPEQSLAMGHLACRITSKVIHDAERATTQVLVPDATEIWTRPCLRLRGDTWRVYPDLAALEADRPDRVLPVAPQVP